MLRAEGHDPAECQPWGESISQRRARWSTLRSPRAGRRATSCWPNRIDRLVVRGRLDDDQKQQPPSQHCDAAQIRSLPSCSAAGPKLCGDGEIRVAAYRISRVAWSTPRSPSSPRLDTLEGSRENCAMGACQRGGELEEMLQVLLIHQVRQVLSMVTVIDIRGCDEWGKMGMGSSCWAI
ncbi:hypothetical protein CC85DRAFT_132528 [Cutaneotrichosporon oleaginosum]|uniref:Uncharacterized protein n=1 Tax=Cutaneotrichosporon oleaginosum TaxID=879819 RepID=A0A0J0XWA8_9TREE|nr:uncharacterized protein CC85DRAFT_132528 [Cutaneotrichosporon oleaginosum]KLT45385.1 hypothetical protein CC85DRAFT_132528 [Cutaneotrichosporon oleaginosum]TXT14650.1 hypothetical protein COLE_00843 [Cutaneotrichosporon oleaginosum]